MSTVYVITEYWDNGEGYPEDYDHETGVLGVAANPIIAERMILRRKRELLD